MIDPYKMVFISLLASFSLGAFTLFYKFIYPKKNINLFALIILISILPVISIFRPGTYQSADLTLHSVFSQSFYTNLSQGNLFPQWAGELCGGHGCPIHMFEYPLPYYISSVFHFLGFSYLNSIKLLLASSFILSGVGMYLWLRKELGGLSAFVGSLFYLFLPYHLEDLHFRASAGEVLSFVPIPFIFLFLREFLTTNRKIYFLLTSLFVGFLLLSHGITLVSVLPVMILYIFFLIKNSKERVKNFSHAILSIFLGFLLTAFYWLPTIFEIKYTWYPPSFVLSDFKPLAEYLYSPAIFGFLFQGQNGELRLIIGYFHLLIIITALFFLRKNKIIKKYIKLVISLLILFFIYFFMMLEISRPIWNIVPLHNTFMFPWRLLIPIGFITSIVAAILVKNFKNIKIVYLLSFLVVITTILNWGNRTMVPEDKNAYYSDVWGYSEYFIPNDLKYQASYKSRIKMEADIVRKRFSSPLKFIEGKGVIKNLERKQISHKYLVNVKENSTLSEVTNYFLGWQIYINNSKYEYNYEDERDFGKMVFSLPKGLYLINIRLEDTGVRKMAKLISIFSFLVFLIILLNPINYLLHKLRYISTKLFHVLFFTHR